MASATAFSPSLTVTVVVCAAAFFPNSTAAPTARIAITHVMLRTPTRRAGKAKRRRRCRRSRSLRPSCAASDCRGSRAARESLQETKADRDRGDAHGSPQCVFLKLVSGRRCRCAGVGFREFEFPELIPGAGKFVGDGFAQVSYAFSDEGVFKRELTVPGRQTRIRKFRADQAERSDALVGVFECDGE